MARVEEINKIEELARLRNTWKTLLDTTPNGTFFQSLEWLEVYWQHFGSDQQLRVIVVRDGDSPSGIVPLVVRTETTRVGRIRFLTYPLDYWGSFYGPIGPQPQSALTAALTHIKKTRRDWDAIELRWIGSTEEALDLTISGMRSAGLRPRSGLRDQTAIIELKTGWEEYFKSRPGKWRSNYRRSERLAKEAGEVKYVRYRPRGMRAAADDPRWDLFDACRGVARASWQGNSTTGTTLTHDEISGFLRDVHAAAARCGALDLNLLLIDDVPVAFAYNYAYSQYVYGLRAGFDAQLAPPGAGNLLLARAIQDSFERGDRVYDLGTGYLAGKRYLHTQLRSIYRCGHFPWLPIRAQLLRWKRQFDHVGRSK